MFLYSHILWLILDKYKEDAMNRVFLSMNDILFFI